MPYPGLPLSLASVTRRFVNECSHILLVLMQGKGKKTREERLKLLVVISHSSKLQHRAP